MIRLLLFLTTLYPIPSACASSGLQQTAAASAPQSPFAGLIAEYLRMDANGHSPTADEIAAMTSLQPQPDAASIAEAMPYLLKALANPDTPLRTFALTAIAGLQSPAPEPAAAAPSDPNIPPLPAGAAPTAPPAPPVYKPDVTKAVAPYIPQIASHLTSEEHTANRLLAATILGGFAPNPPPAVYPPLLAFLKRDDAIGEVGLAVVGDLLQLGPVSEETAAAITRYLRRSDQTPESRANLADQIAAGTRQSQVVNKSLLTYLDSDDNSLRARVILSLPQLDLSANVFAETKARVERIASDSNENLQVITAAKAVAPCWNATRMASNCPIY